MYVKFTQVYYSTLRGQYQRYYLVAYDAHTDQEIARIGKRVFAQDMLGWSADSEAFYFQVLGRTRLDESPVFALHLDPRP